MNPTTYDHWLSAQSGFRLLELATKPQQRRDILLWIKRDLTAARNGSTSARFQARCAELLEVVRLELAELEPQQIAA